MLMMPLRGRASAGCRVAGADNSIGVDDRQPRRRALLRYVPMAALIVMLACTAPIALSARAADASDNDGGTPGSPTVYLDLNTAYVTVPPDTLALGLRNFTLPIGVSAQSVQVIAPLTVEISDRLSVYAGVGASTSRTCGRLMC